MWWRKNHKTLILGVISAITGLISAYFLLRAETESAVFLFDPDVVYTSNAISYVSTGQIHYIDHPGTPTIRLLAFFLWPLRIYSKLVAQSTFIHWTFIHYSFVLVYLRFFQSILLSTAIFIFLYSVSKISNSYISAIFAWLAVLVYSSLLYFGSAIVPETTSIFLISIYFFTFTKFIQKRSLFGMLTLSFLSGLLIGNKFTNLFIVVFSCGLPLLNSKYNITKRGLIAIISLFIAIGGFILATWPIHNSYSSLFNWSLKLASTTEVHGGGKNSFIDISSYLNSATTLITRELSASYVVAFGLVLIVFISVLKHRFIPELLALAFSGFAGVLLFSKYPLSHYHLANYLMLLFSISYYFSQLPRLIKVLSITLLIPLTVTSILQYVNSLNRTLAWAQNLRSYVKQNPPRKAAMWHIGETVDFARLWSRVWAGGLFTDELALRPDLLDYSLIEEQDMFKRCWDKFYTRTTTAQKFIAHFPNRQLKYIPIPNTNGSAVIESDHCLTTP